MRPLAALALVVLFASFVHADPLPTASPEAVGVSSAKLAKVTDVMNKQVADGKLAGGVVIVARDGKVVYFESFGKRDIDADKPMEKDTIVRIYSMTKSIATAGALMLVDDGKIAPDDPVSKHVPELKDVRVYVSGEGDDMKTEKPKREMTIADLMRHTAGFGRGGRDPVGKLFGKVKINTAQTLTEEAEMLASIPLKHHPGERWVYSNSIDILGLVIERVSGQRLDDYLKERLLDPLGMKDTDFWVVESKRDRFAANYNRTKDGLKPIKNANARYFARPTRLSGGGGMVGTAEDYARFLMMIANGGEWNGKRYLKPETVKLMTTDQLPPSAYPIGFSGNQERKGTGFGFGFNVRREVVDAWDPDGRVGEFGWGGAASTHYWVSPRDKNLVVVTLEQVMPYQWDTERLVKPLVYDAIEK